MQLAERIFVKENPAMANLCRKQTAVYNQSLFYLRQEYTYLGSDWKVVVGKDGVEKRVSAGFINQFDLTDKVMLRWKQCFRDANPTCAANTVKRACDAWKAFWAALAEWHRNPSVFTGRPKMPNYKGDNHCRGCRAGDQCTLDHSKSEKSPVYLTYIQFSIKDGVVVFANVLGLPVLSCVYPDQKTGDSTGVVKQIRIIPNKLRGYWVELVHVVDVVEKQWDTTRIMAIDLGLVRIATCVDNVGGEPIAFLGGPFIEINHWYNKEMARLQAEQARCDPRAKVLQQKFSADKDSLTDEEWYEWKHRKRYTPKMRALTDARNNKMVTNYHRLSRIIVDVAVERNLGVIVVGHNPGQKQNINLGDKTNQKFSQQPLFKLIDKIRYKAEMESITVVEVTEEFTSKASFLDGDVIPDRKKTKKKANGHSDVSFSGARAKRGLYKSARGVKIQADVNGAYNILRKAFPDAFKVEGMAAEGNPARAVRLHPRILSIPVS